MEHTKLPWTLMAIIPTNVLAGGLRVARCDFDGQDNAEARANAAFIVRAVNAHQELVEACEAVLDGIFTVTDHCAICGGDAARREHVAGCVVIAVQAALAKAAPEGR